MFEGLKMGIQFEMRACGRKKWKNTAPQDDLDDKLVGSHMFTWYVNSHATAKKSSFDVL